MGIKSNNPAESYYNYFANSGTDASTPSPFIAFGLSASGGTEETYTQGEQKYKSHTFLTSGSFVVSSLSPNDPTYNELECLLVGGGGCGGKGQGGGGGGGAGGMIATPITAVVQTYPVTVGDGMAYNPTNAPLPATPTDCDSYFGPPSPPSGVTMNGGGGGGNGENPPHLGVATPGNGSGGGGGAGPPSGPDRAEGAGGSNGNKGGMGSQGGNSTGCGGGGGGAGGGGHDADPGPTWPYPIPNPNAGRGGNGKPNSYRYGDPTSDHPSAGNIYYAGGGAGGWGGAAPPNSAGGGRGGALPERPYGNSTGEPGTANTGGGGGGGGARPGYGGPGGDGGSGICVVRYKIAPSESQIWD